MRKFSLSPALIGKSSDCKNWPVGSRISKITCPNFTKFSEVLVASTAAAQPVSVNVAIRHVLPVLWMTSSSGDAGKTLSAIFGQPGTKYIIYPAKFVKFLLSHAKRHGS